ncbi:uncharacterized protein B0P05DRAFT_527681 [Gilbertella persicaria]|uniref:RING-type domain-containing protein n=1 Tax=Rhizopus stolonifer TaxID=4846 RepID=A0A367KUU7_RHIST|nr:uncharacterized protein B0P05DRAFT_527681 [Gilbertella persicaria]KAI8091469.1 hypothetical protein B0P05DRAFT_527681 [Gilbertella persicaria]RCI05983.1 hypothetical protein CU098_012575 [Rhizopus stolonifer]
MYKMPRPFSNHPPARKEATQWASWVDKEVQQHSDQTIDSLPEKLHRISPNASATTIPLHYQQQQQQNKGYYVIPNKEQLAAILPEKTLCFCSKPAYRSYTLEYGPILECGNFANDPTIDSDPPIHRLQKQFVCGFHVHETSWKRVCDQIRQKNTVHSEYTELRTCPLYNFTYCTMFRLTNSFKMDTPTILPECFCHRPVVMRIHPKEGVQFACKNSFVDGAPKCSWVLKASEVAFPRPKYRIHTFVDNDTYIQQKQHKVKEIKKKSAEDYEREHKHELLAALTGSSHNIPEEKLCLLNQKAINFNDLVLEEEKRQKALIVPTCVMANKKAPRQLSTTTSTSSCSSASSAVTSSIQYFSADMEIIVKENADLKLDVTKNRRTIELLNASMDDIKQKNTKLKTEVSRLQKDMYRSQNEKEEETVLRMNCQERLTSIELDFVRLMNEKEKIQEELLLHIEEKKKLSGHEDDRTKCVLCFTQLIEYCLVPCYHYAYCHLCASRLTECAICRRSIEKIQKIYAP